MRGDSALPAARSSRSGARDPLIDPKRSKDAATSVSIGAGDQNYSADHSAGTQERNYALDILLLGQCGHGKLVKPCREGDRIFPGVETQGGGDTGSNSALPSRLVPVSAIFLPFLVFNCWL